MPPPAPPCLSSSSPLLCPDPLIWMVGASAFELVQLHLHLSPSHSHTFSVSSTDFRSSSLDLWTYPNPLYRCLHVFLTYSLQFLFHCLPSVLSLILFIHVSSKHSIHPSVLYSSLISILNQPNLLHIHSRLISSLVSFLTVSLFTCLLQRMHLHHFSCPQLPGLSSLLTTARLHSCLSFAQHSSVGPCSEILSCPLPQDHSECLKWFIVTLLLVVACCTISSFHYLFCFSILIPPPPPQFCLFLCPSFSSVHLQVSLFLRLVCPHCSSVYFISVSAQIDLRGHS